MSQQRYIALLGGINAGGHRVKMDHLRGLFQALGLLNVATFIASGNVIFETATDDVRSLQTRIEHHLTQELGYLVPTFIRSTQELADIAGYQPFPALDISDTTSTLSIMFLSEVFPVELRETFLSFSTTVDSFDIHGREIYWLCRGKITESLVNWTRLGKTMPMPRVTVRNVTTVRKLAERYAV
jgi:uncharacterized protein (DUF1697 family)